MSLNELDRELKGQLCPTDSRLRPDVRLLEQGDIDGAAAEKTRLEDKQRTARKTLKKSADGWQPRYGSYECSRKVRNRTIVNDYESIDCNFY